jgi:hypothetical protein
MERFMAWDASSFLAGKAMGKPLENHRKTMGKTMGKGWKRMILEDV